MTNAKAFLLGIAILILAVSPCGAQPFDRSDRTLLLDHLDEDFVPDGARTEEVFLPRRKSSGANTFRVPAAMALCRE